MLYAGMAANGQNIASESKVCTFDDLNIDINVSTEDLIRQVERLNLPFGSIIIGGTKLTDLQIQFGLLNEELKLYRIKSATGGVVYNLIATSINTSSYYFICNVLYTSKAMDCIWRQPTI